MRTEYIIETFYLGRWLRVLSASRDYCRGYISARKDYAPRNAYRIVRDGKIIEEMPAVADVYIGQIAGWPTAEQYESAARKAMERAKAIREKEEKP